MEVDFTFSSGDDARRYLGEVGMLWIVWIAALFAVTFGPGGWRALGGVAGIGLVMWRSQPLLRRAAALVPDDEATRSSGFRGGTRERTFRKLAYGLEPLQAAVSGAGASTLWYGARLGMITLTVLGFAAVVVEYLA